MGLIEEIFDNGYRTSLSSKHDLVSSQQAYDRNTSMMLCSLNLYCSI